MLSTKINSDKKFLLFLGVITLVGFFLRLRGLATESITADEASALYRLKFPSFSEMINQGVRPDGHPAFTQVLLWFWTKWFGWSEFSIRFPFAIFGTASIWLSGVIARKWFSSGAGLATAAGMAFLQFPLMYSQLARPYAPGLFFTLLAVYFCARFVNDKSKSKLNIVGFAFAAALAAYSHYFSLLTTTLIAFAGIFYVSKEIRLRYLLSCAIAVLLFLPHLSITLNQISIGGIGGPDGWLGKPTPHFFMDHLKFAFNSSGGMLWAVLVISLLSFILFFKKPDKFQLLSLLIWFLPMAIGYIYSIKRNPVLQDSVLLFGLPFLLMFLFSRIPELNAKKFAMIFPFGFAIAFLGYVTIYKPYHLTDHFGRLKELVTNAVFWQTEYYTPNVDVAYNVDGPFMIEYNYESIGETPKNVLATTNNGGKDLIEFRNMVENSDAEFFVYGWSTKYSPLEILPIIREQFPYLIEKKLWFNSGIYLFSKLNALSRVDEKGEILFESELGFSGETTIKEAIKKGDKRASWSTPFKLDSELVSMDYSVQVGTEHYPVYYSIFHGKIDSTNVYSPLLKMKVADILTNPDNEILFTVKAQLLDSTSDLVMVIQFEREGREPLWNGREASSQIDPMDWKGFHTIYFGLQLPKDLKATDTVSFFCYTKDGKPILLDYLEVKTLKGHTNLYGPRPNIQ